MIAQVALNLREGEENEYNCIRVSTEARKVSYLNKKFTDDAHLTTVAFMLRFRVKSMIAQEVSAHPSSELQSCSKALTEAKMPMLLQAFAGRNT